MVDWKQIIDEHGTAVWRQLWRMLGNRADADECFQETFLAAVKVSRRQKIESWPALLRGLATARAMDRLRQRYRQNDLLGITGDASGNGRSVPVESVASAEPDPSGRLVARELSQRLRKALARLPGKQAEAICLYALDGWSHQKIGLQLGMTENSVGVTIHRARQRLRELLGDPSPLARSGRGAGGEGRPSTSPLARSGRGAGGEGGQKPTWIVRNFGKRVAIMYPGFVPILDRPFSLAQAFHAWGNDDGIVELSGPFYGPPASPTNRTPVNGRDTT